MKSTILYVLLCMFLTVPKIEASEAKAISSNLTIETQEIVDTYIRISFLFPQLSVDSKLDLLERIGSFSEENRYKIAAVLETYLALYEVIRNRSVVDRIFNQVSVVNTKFDKFTLLVSMHKVSVKVKEKSRFLPDVMAAVSPVVLDGMLKAGINTGLETFIELADVELKKFNSHKLFSQNTSLNSVTPGERLINTKALVDNLLKAYRHILGL
ncbi:MAG: hypothetical protein AB8E15_12665 [Bdellovibrionales bacterium]